jgi:hypothetical protein
LSLSDYHKASVYAGSGNPKTSKQTRKKQKNGLLVCRFTQRTFGKSIKQIFGNIGIFAFDKAEVL